LFQKSKEISKNTQHEIYWRAYSWCVWEGKVKSSNSWKIKTIVDVLYVQGLSKNLLSIGMIIDKRNIMVFDFGKCLIIENNDPNTIVAKGVRDPKNGLYKLEVHSK